MKNGTRFVGLDDSKNSIDVAVASEGRDGEVRSYGTIENTPNALKKLVRRLGRPKDLHFVYEAGPCGYGHYRDLLALGANCMVAAPSKTPRRSGDRIKTDRRDALMLARLHRMNSDLDGRIHVLAHHAGSGARLKIPERNQGDIDIMLGQAGALEIVRLHGGIPDVQHGHPTQFDQMTVVLNFCVFSTAVAEREHGHPRAPLTEYVRIAILRIDLPDPRTGGDQLPAFLTHQPQHL